MRSTIWILALLASANTCAQTPQSASETIRRSPTARPIPLPRTFSFAPLPDLTSEELERLGPYLKGKPLYDEDQKALGTAMRHLKPSQ